MSGRGPCIYISSGGPGFGVGSLSLSEMVGPATHFLFGAALLAAAVNAQNPVWSQCVRCSLSLSLSLALQLNGVGNADTISRAELGGPAELPVPLAQSAPSPMPVSRHHRRLSACGT